MRAPVPAEQQVLVKCVMLGADDMSHYFSAVEELEVAIDSEDVTCAVSIIREKANHVHKNSRSRR